MRGRSKFGAVRTKVDGISFASKKEAKRYGELKILERAGEITDLKLQPRYPLVVNGMKVCTYVADFLYHNTFRGATMAQPIVEDAKGFKTPEYKLKAKLFLALHGFPITEV